MCLEKQFQRIVVVQEVMITLKKCWQKSVHPELE